jgi:hypothetical protein
MIPKEFAINLFNKHYLLILEIDNDLSQEIIISILAKKHALLTVDEILSIKLLWFQKDFKDIDYWNEVKKEIKKL